MNYSSARMARIELKANVREWREHMLLPQLCDGVWKWVMELASAYQGWNALPTATWSCPPLSILEPDKEAAAYTRMVRSGFMTWPQVILELGYDPREQIEEIEQYNELLDEAGIVLDSDARRTNQAGQLQQAATASGEAASSSKPAADASSDEADDKSGDDTADAGDASTAH